MNLSIDLNILTCEPAEEYHARAGENLSSHQLIDFMKSPFLHFKKSEGLLENKDSPAYLIGRAAHARILEGREAYQSQFALGGPINPKTGQPFGSATKAFAEWAEAQGKPVLSHDQVALVEQMADALGITRQENEAAIRRLLTCRQKEMWPTGYEEVRLLDVT